MKRFLIFGLLGPAGTFLSVYFGNENCRRWWWPHPSINLAELLLLLLCASFDQALRNAGGWGRLLCVGAASLLASGVTCALFTGAWVFGVFAVIFAMACSLLAWATDVGEIISTEQ
ncbi:MULTISPECIES: hypothetical protein [unclassified Bradyrhizobium]|uniref:hypothetical protein n=1 Tax=unclassified Bradyrhizobium TaxID=2631580 RepID=UPI001BA531EF|nr:MULTISPECIES: hypothetical protein [unclassified Bradyrhizobium]MBR1224985.1 hypothetical protein [Bradyrhizobium sp. AUGA SZCCT0176]MBR1300382.1 hypothetical protein [Bradyrhizobium sp. AUGA SZCCT0042]